MNKLLALAILIGVATARNHWPAKSATSKSWHPGPHGATAIIPQTTTALAILEDHTLVWPSSYENGTALFGGLFGDPAIASVSAMAFFGHPVCGLRFNGSISCSCYQPNSMLDCYVTMDNIPSSNDKFDMMAPSTNGLWYARRASDWSLETWGLQRYDDVLPIPEPNSEWADFGVGLTHACGIRAATGEIACWGSNSLDSFRAQLRMPPAGTNANFTQISVGHRHQCAIRADKTLWCGGTASKDIKIPAPNSDWAMIASAHMYTCALRMNGTINCWGTIDGPSTLKVPQPNLDFISVHAGGYSACGVKKNGTIVCWGEPTDALPTNYTKYVPIICRHPSYLNISVLPVFCSYCGTGKEQCTSSSDPQLCQRDCRCPYGYFGASGSCIKADDTLSSSSKDKKSESESEDDEA